MSIIIFSRAIRTGKTTEIMKWCKDKNDIGGILMPDVDGLRKMVDIKTRESFTAECTSPQKTEEELLIIGKFSFYKSAFEKGSQILLTSLQEQPKFLIIDEVGKLELQHQGFYKAVLEITQNHSSATTVIIVVRDTLLHDVIQHFQITNFQITHQL